MESWARARRCYKALPEEEMGGIGGVAMKMMEDEMPSTHLGVLLFMWLRMVGAAILMAANCGCCRSCGCGWWVLRDLFA